MGIEPVGTRPLLDLWERVGLVTRFCRVPDAFPTRWERVALGAHPDGKPNALETRWKRVRNASESVCRAPSPPLFSFYLSLCGSLAVRTPSHSMQATACSLSATLKYTSSGVRTLALPLRAHSRYLRATLCLMFTTARMPCNLPDAPAPTSDAGVFPTRSQRVPNALETRS